MKRLEKKELRSRKNRLKRRNSTAATKRYRFSTIDVKRVKNALESDQYEYRTLSGIVKETKLPRRLVFQILNSNADIIRSRKVNQFGERLYISKSKIEKRSKTEKFLSALAGSID